MYLVREAGSSPCCYQWILYAFSLPTIKADSGPALCRKPILPPEQKGRVHRSRPELSDPGFSCLNLHRSWLLIQFPFHGGQSRKAPDSDAAGCVHSRGRTADPRVAASEARAEDQDRWPDRRAPRAQRACPPTAKGFCFLADEVPDGMVNVVVPPGVLFLSGKFCPGDLGRHAGDLPLLNLEYDHGIAIIPPREFLRPFGPPPGPQPSLLPWYGELAAIGQAGFVDWQSRE